MQGLYFCIPFREAVLKWAREPTQSKVRKDEDSMLVAVAEMFQVICTNKKKFAPPIARARPGCARRQAQCGPCVHAALLRPSTDRVACTSSGA
jgi:hypothetical protein